MMGAGARRTCNGTARDGAVPLDLCRVRLLGDGACGDGLDDVACVGDLDLAGLGFLGDGDGQCEHAVFVGGGDVVAVEALSEEQLRLNSPWARSAIWI